MEEKEEKENIIESLENPEQLMPLVKKLEEEKGMRREESEEIIYKDEYDQQIKLF